MAELDCCFLTLNCSNTAVDSVFLGSCLADVLDKHDATPKIIFVALQELAAAPDSLIGGSLIAPYIDKVHAAVDEMALTRNLERYELVESCLINWVAGLLFALPDVTQHISKVQTASTRLVERGFGNKAAVGIRFYYENQDGLAAKFTFVGSHLLHGEGKCEQRNKDWQAINQHLIFTDPSSPAPTTETTEQSSVDEQDPLLPSNNEGSTSGRNTNKTQAIFSHGSYLFFGGDLNYRTSDTLPGPEDYKSYPQPSDTPSSPNHWSHCLDHDQLTRERNANRTLHGLHEEAITFPPTFKFSAAANDLVTRKSTARDSDLSVSKWLWAPHRYPSWCDRILYSRPSVRELWPSIRAYTSLPLQPTSDHQPVTLLFAVPLRRIDQDGQQAEIEWPRSPFEIVMPTGVHSYKSLMRAAEVVLGVEAWFVLTWQGRVSALGLGLTVLAAWYAWSS